MGHSEKFSHTHYTIFLHKRKRKTMNGARVIFKHKHQDFQLMKDVKSQIQEVLQSPERAIEKKTTPTHITVKQWKTKTERKLQKDSKTRIQCFQNTNHKTKN